MRTLLILLLLSVPAFAAKTELEPKPQAPGQILVCEQKATKTKELQQGKCELPKSFHDVERGSLGERKSK